MYLRTFAPVAPSSWKAHLPIFSWLPPSPPLILFGTCHSLLFLVCLLQLEYKKFWMFFHCCYCRACIETGQYINVNKSWINKTPGLPETVTQGVHCRRLEVSTLRQGWGWGSRGMQRTTCASGHRGLELCDAGLPTAHHSYALFTFSLLAWTHYRFLMISLIFQEFFTEYEREWIW